MPRCFSLASPRHTRQSVSQHCIPLFFSPPLSLAPIQALGGRKKAKKGMGFEAFARIMSQVLGYHIDPHMDISELSDGASASASGESRSVRARMCVCVRVCVRVCVCVCVCV